MNQPKDNFYCVILAGGKGRRLWPCSRSAKPKQFVDFFGTGRTQLQQTYDRMAKIVPPDHIYVATNMEYRELVKEQLPELPGENMLLEPIFRNTAASVSWACHRIGRRNACASIIAVPSDQLIMNEDAFRENALLGLEFVQAHDCFLTMGVKPTRPEPGYGYIQLGDPVGDNLYHVQSFTEKPEREFAKMFLESGEFYWNTGLFLSNARYIKESFSRLLPAVLRSFDAETKDFSIAAEEEYIQEHFSAYPNMSIDYGILEKSENVYVMKCDFGWADLGTWHSIYEAHQKADGDNVVVNSDVMLDNCHGNVIKLPKGMLGVISGLEGFIVAEHDNVLLICKKEDSSSLIKKYVNEVQIRKGENYV